MDATELITFETVARVGSITRASAILNTVQSNVTARIQALEIELQVKLLHRHSRGVALTVAGRRLLPYARRLTRLLAETRSALSENAAPGGCLAVGMLESIAATTLPLVLMRYRTAFPEVELVLRTGTTAELVEAVLHHELEGAFVAGPVGHPDLSEEVVGEEELVLLAAASHLPLQVWQGNTLVLLVLKGGCAWRHRLLAAVARRGLLNFQVVELGTVDAILGLVAAGVGTSLLPRAVVARSLEQGNLSIEALPDDERTLATMFVRRSDGFFSAAARHLVDHLKAFPVAPRRVGSAVMAGG